MSWQIRMYPEFIELVNGERKGKWNHSRFYTGNDDSGKWLRRRVIRFLGHKSFEELGDILNHPRTMSEFEKDLEYSMSDRAFFVMRLCYAISDGFEIKWSGCDALDDLIVEGEE